MHISAQKEILDTLQFQFRFMQAQSALDMQYHDNDSEMNRIVDCIGDMVSRSDYEIVAVNIEGNASPEGDIDKNAVIAMRRALEIRSFILSNTSLNYDVVRAYSLGVDREKLVGLLNESACEQCDTLVNIIRSNRHTPVSELYSALQQFDDGKPWQWMLDSIFPKMRTGNAWVVYRDPTNQINNTRVIQVRDTVFTRDTVYIARTPLIQQKKPIETDTLPYRRKPVAALRTNLLLPLLNVGIEIPIGNRWSVGADWYYPWLWRNWHKSTEMKNCFELLMGGVEVRYWLGPKHKSGGNNQKYRLTGHSLGTYVYGGYFDIGKDFSGRQGEFFNVGLDYMYSINLGRRFKMEFSLGIGFIHSSARKYSIYDAGGHAYRNGVIERVNWFGPTKATVSLVFPLYRKVRKEVPKP